MQRDSGLIVAATVTGLTVVVGLPVLFVVLQAIFPDLGAGSLHAPFSGFAGLLADGRTLALLGNTTRLGLGVAVGCFCVALPLAMLRGMTRLPGANAWDLLFLIPFMVPPYIGAFAWVLALQPRGFLDQLIGVQGGNFLFSYWGIAAVMTLHLFPVVYFALAQTLAVVGRGFADAARVCGASPLRAFLRITLPLSLPGLAASLLLVFALTIEEYGTPATLGPQSGFAVLVTSIEEKYAEYPIDPSGAASLSLILVVLALSAFGLQSWMVGRRSHVAVSGRHIAAPEPRSRLWPIVGLVTFLLVAVLAIVIPVGSVILTAFSRTLSGGLTAANFGLRNFELVLGNSNGGLDALLNSLWLAALTALLAGVLGGMTAYVTTRTETRGRGLADALSALPNALPGIVIAVGMILAWNRDWWPLPIYNHAAVLLLAYLCLTLPYPVRYVGAGLRQIGPSLDAAARVSGAGSGMMIRRILLPLVGRHLVAAMLLVFAIASRELIASVMLAPPGMKTVATYVFNQFAQGTPGVGMALSVIAIFSSTTILVALGHAYRSIGR